MDGVSVFISQKQMKILLTMHTKLNFFSLNVGMSSTLAGLPAIIKAENLDIIFFVSGIT